MRKPRTPQQKELDAAMKAQAAMYLLDSIVTLLGSVPQVDVKLSKQCFKWSHQLIKERNRMLPLADAADELLA